MTITIIVLLIILGLLLLILEFFVIPGVTIAGIGGGILIGVGILMTYNNFGNVVGNIVTFSTVFVSVLAIAISLRSGTWKKLMLNSSIDSQVTVVIENSIGVGENAVAVTRLNPVGKARVGDQIIEAHCPGRFIDENTELEVVKVFKTYIVVKPKS